MTNNHKINPESFLIDKSKDTKKELATFWSITVKNRILFNSHLFIKYLENFGFKTVKISLLRKT